MKYDLHLSAQVSFDNGLTVKDGQILTPETESVNELQNVLIDLTESITTDGNPKRAAEDLAWKLKATTNWLPYHYANAETPEEVLRRYAHTLRSEFSRHHPFSWDHIASITIWFKDEHGENAERTYRRGERNANSFKWFDPDKVGESLISAYHGDGCC